MPAPQAASESAQGGRTAQTFAYRLRSGLQSASRLRPSEPGQKQITEQQRRRQLPAAGKGTVRRHRRVAQQEPSVAAALLGAQMAVAAVVEAAVAPEWFFSIDADCESFSATHSSTQLGCGHIHA